jgi:signal transduction histidine kinase
MIQRIRATLRLADDLIKSVRRISTDLRPGILDLGLSAAGEWQAQEFQARTGIPCKLRLLAEEVVVAPDVSTALFRILQETLTNVARHARATRTEVVLQRQREGLALSIRDDGRGFDPVDPSLSKSLGLLGIRERAAMLGGRLSISSTPGNGTRITAWIPLASSQESRAIP